MDIIIGILIRDYGNLPSSADYIQQELRGVLYFMSQYGLITLKNLNPMPGYSNHSILQTLLGGLANSPASLSLLIDTVNQFLLTNENYLTQGEPDSSSDSLKTLDLYFGQLSFNPALIQNMDFVKKLDTAISAFLMDDSKNSTALMFVAIDLISANILKMGNFDLPPTNLSPVYQDDSELQGVMIDLISEPNMTFFHFLQGHIQSAINSY